MPQRYRNQYLVQVTTCHGWTKHIYRLLWARTIVWVLGRCIDKTQIKTQYNPRTCRYICTNIFPIMEYRRVGRHNNHIGLTSIRETKLFAKVSIFDHTADHAWKVWKGKGDSQAKTKVLMIPGLTFAVRKISSSEEKWPKAIRYVNRARSYTLQIAKTAR